MVLCRSIQHSITNNSFSKRTSTRWVIASEFKSSNYRHFLCEQIMWSGCENSRFILRRTLNEYVHLIMYEIARIKWTNKQQRQQQGQWEEKKDIFSLLLMLMLCWKDIHLTQIMITMSVLYIIIYYKWQHWQHIAREWQQQQQQRLQHQRTLMENWNNSVCFPPTIFQMLEHIETCWC